MRSLLIKCLALLIIGVAFSCSDEKNTPMEKSDEAMNLKKITEEYNNFHIRNPAAYYEDKVNFEISDGNVVISVGEDGNYKTSFTIQMWEINKKHLNDLTSGRYDIAYLEKDLIFSSPEKTLYFAIDGQPEFEDIAAGAVNFNVYGIAKWHNDGLY